MAQYWVYLNNEVAGPFGVGSIDARLLETQLFIATVSVSALSLAALVAEREQLTARLRVSSARVVAASDEARRRFERDLHDGAQQRLVALAARLSVAAEGAQQAGEEAARSLVAAEKELLLAIGELREFSRGMHPAVLRDFGLAKAVAAVARRSTVQVEASVPRERFDDTAEATAYYVVLEAITNAQRYAGASSVRVRAKLRHDVLLLDVGDDGVGGAVEREGSGLQGLRDRVEATGGRFRVRSEPGQATHITAVIPVSPRGAERLRSGDRERRRLLW